VQIGLPRVTRWGLRSNAWGGRWGARC
jgi:hypothetical protein